MEEATKLHWKEMKRKKEQEETSADEDRKTPSTGEFLSGFWADDRLIPSITMTIFFELEEWDEPLSLFEMMDVSDSDVLACMHNYHVRLIAPAQIPDEEIMKFQSSLREVMLFIKYSKDKENLSRVLSANEGRFREVERRVADVIGTITNSGIKYDESEEVVNVCQAIQEMRKEFERDGELKKAREAAVKLYGMGLDTEKIAQAVGYAVNTVKGWLGIEL
ncbi:MAG: hypothetical protein K2G70_06610 [Turicibacter sp.]|nr:hypothetical protein [Turicibacter sp.]